MRIDQPDALRSFLKRHRLDPDKQLGQHFLCSPVVVDKIIEATHGCASVLEIGPGPGILTAPLTEKIPNVVAVELDARMPKLLESSAPACKVISGDALKIDLAEIVSSLPGPVGIVSNMPYYISAPLLQRMADQFGLESDIRLI